MILSMLISNTNVYDNGFFFVRGIEWTSLNSFLSFGYQMLTNAQGKVRNELIYTHTQTGYKLALRVNKTEESPIEMIRVSYLKYVQLSS